MRISGGQNIYTMSLAVACLMAMALFLPLRAQARTKPLKDDVGLEMIREGRFDDAIAWCENGLKKNPEDTDLLLKAGTAWLYKSYFTNRGVKESLAYHERAVSIDPLNGLARYQYGAALMAADRPQDAVAQLRSTTALAPDFPPAYMGLVVTYMKMGDPARAMAAFNRLSRSNRDYAMKSSLQKPKLKQKLRSLKLLMFRQVNGGVSRIMLWAGDGGDMALHARRVLLLFGVTAVALMAMAAAGVWRET